MLTRARESQAGFTIVEVMVAATVLLIGVLGTVSMVDASNDITTSNDRRASGGAVARDIVEAVRGLPYTAHADGTLAAKAQAQAGLADASAASGWQVKRSNTEYTIALTSCAVDDPKDGAGAHDATFCSNTIPAGTADSKPNDYSRLTVSISWSTDKGKTDKVEQSTIVNNTFRGPAVSKVDTSPTAGITTIYAGNSQEFTATTNPAASRVEWYVDGKYRGTGTGSGSTWKYVWNLGTTVCSGTSSSSLPDGTYQIGAQAYDAAESSFGPAYRQITLNRCAPAVVKGLEGGRNTYYTAQVPATPGVKGIELQWQANAEDDVAGYRVLRATSSGGPYSLVTTGTGDATTRCDGLIDNGRTECIDPDVSPIAGTTVYYKVVAYDYDASGNLRAGATMTTPLTVTTSNRAPATPTIYSGSYNGQSYGTLFWTPVSDPDSGDSISFYRIYRDGKLITDRYDVYDWLGGQYVLWDDENTGGTTHTYWVTAVDTHMRESTVSNSVTR